jgi:hypothetical protein
MLYYFIADRKQVYKRIKNMSFKVAKSLGLVSCTKEKKNYPCKASEMYLASDLFKKAYRYANKNYSAVAILSAKYGLLLPSDKIEPYNITLKDMNIKQVKSWADRVFEQMKEKLNLNEFETVFFHAGKRYRIYLIPKLEDTGLKCEAPLGNMKIGEQKAWYMRHDC